MCWWTFSWNLEDRSGPDFIFLRLICFQSLTVYKFSIKYLRSWNEFAMKHKPMQRWAESKTRSFVKNLSNLAAHLERVVWKNPKLNRILTIFSRHRLKQKRMAKKSLKNKLTPKLLTGLNHMRLLAKSWRQSNNSASCHRLMTRPRIPQKAWLKLELKF